MVARRSAVFLACAAGSAAAFSVPPSMQLRGSRTDVAVDCSASPLGRRQMLGATLFGAGAILVNPQVASARKEVSDGGLPPGIAEYMGVVKAKKQWTQIGKRVAEGHAEMPAEEWTNIQGFLRKFYDTGKEMEEVSNAFSNDERKAVAEVAKGFKKAVKAIDKPAKEKDWEAFMTQHAQLLAYIEDFQDIRAGKKKEVKSSQNGVVDL
mmetsp:Transcript_27002/g.22683  ORF Transcript_27002/g.22683 Transcript_27002/m.22683 type:complete len:208 (+) Transcript_27002:11-634(+)